MTPKQQKALLALLTSPTREKAAAAAGITSKTLRGYLADPAFQAEYKKAFSGLVEDAARQAQQAIAPALSTLREIVEDTGENSQARIPLCSVKFHEIPINHDKMQVLGDWLPLLSAGYMQYALVLIIL